MLTRKDVFSIGETLIGTVTDNPFEGDFDTTVFRHGDSGKWYALLMRVPFRKVGIDKDGETDVLNLKCDPVVSYGIKATYAAVIPAYHMNKYHWISIILETGVPIDVLQVLMGMSYDLTKPKKVRKKVLQIRP